MAELDKKLADELIKLAKLYEEESAQQYRAAVRRTSQIVAMVAGESAPGDWYDSSRWAWRPAKESEDYNDNTKQRYNYRVNYMQAWWQILQGAIQTVGLPVPTFRPQNAQQKLDREAAQTGREIITYEATVTDFREMMLGIYRRFCESGICLAYTRHVKDPVRWGTTTAHNPVTEPQVTRPAGYGCPGCEGFTPSGKTVRDEMGMIECPQCQQPLHAENFMEEQVEDMVVGDQPEEVPNGREITELFGTLEVLLPWWKHTLADSHYCRIAIEVATEEIIGTFASDKNKERAKRIEDELRTKATEDGKTDALARQHARSPMTAGGMRQEGFVTYSRWWFRPKCFYKIEDKPNREELLEKFPKGVFFQLAGGDDPVFLDAIEEHMESKLRLGRPMDGDGMYTPAILQSGVPVQLASNDAYNMALEGMLFAAFAQAYADEDLFSGAAINKTRVEPGNVKLLQLTGGKKIRDSFFEMKSQDVSQSVQNFLGMAEPLGEFLLGTPPAIQGRAIKGVRTSSGQSQARSQALQRQAPAYGALKTLLAGVQECTVNEFLQNRSAETYFDVVSGTGDLEVSKIQLNPERGRVVAYPEASESIPQTWAQQHDVNMALLDSQNPIVQSWMASPENAQAIFETIGTNLTVPGKDMVDKYERIIDLLLEDAPRDEETPNELDPTMPPLRITVPSIPFHPVLDDAQIALTVFRKWAATPDGMREMISGSPGSKNIAAYAEQASLELKAAMKSPPGAGPAKQGVVA